MAVSSLAHCLQRHLNLDSLCLGGPWLTTTSAAALATITSLTHLELYKAPFLRANGLEKLTQLRRLQAFNMEGVGAKRGVAFTLDNTVKGVGRLQCTMHSLAGAVVG